MAFIEWNNVQYSVKVEQFDNDHKKLMGFINELHEAMLQGRGKDKLNHILSELLDYTHYHFDAEEKQLAEAGYPELEEHKQLHQELIGQLEELITDFTDGKREISVKTFRFLKEWLFDHIQVADKKYSPWLKK